MITVNRLNDFISGAVNGKQFSVTFDEKKYTAMKELEAKANSVETMEELKSIVAEFEPFTKESFKELVETSSPYLFVNKHTNKYFLKFKNVVSSIALPQALVDKILVSLEKNIDIAPLVKCWARYLRHTPGRPAYSAARAAAFANYLTQTYLNKEMAEKLVKEEGLSQELANLRATTTQVSITQEGLIVGYKVSREILHKYELNENEEVVQKSRYKKNVDPDTGAITYDAAEFNEDRLFEPCVQGQSGDEFWSGDKKGHFIRVGKSHWLENWNQVSTPGSKGLHCGGLSYIVGYQQPGTVTHNIFIDPADVHSTNCGGEGVNGAMTVKRYFVHSTFNGVNKSIYHSSKYAALNDTEYSKLLEEVTKETETAKDELNKALEEQLDLA